MVQETSMMYQEPAKLVHRGKPVPLTGGPGIWRLGAILLAVGVTTSAAISGLVYRSSYAPLLVGGAVAAIVILLVGFGRPIWLLYVTLFLVLFPEGLYPAGIQSPLNRGLTVVVLVAWASELIIRRRRIVWTGSTSLMLGFVAWSAVTLLWAADLDRGLTILQTYGVRFALYLLLVPNLVRTEKDLDGLMGTLALNGWILVGLSVFQALQGGYGLHQRLTIGGVNENELGLVILLTLPGGLWRAIRPAAKPGIGTLSLALILLLSAIMVVAMTGSRGSAISLVGVLLIFCLWRPTRLWGVLGLVFLASGAAIAPLLFSTTLERFLVTRGDTLLGGREGLWRGAWDLISERIWHGVGIGNSPYEVIPYLAMYRNVGGSDFASIHNPLLTVWAETGIPGLLLYLSVLGSGVFSFVRHGLFSRGWKRLTLRPYVALVSAIFVGLMFSWIKGGAMETEFAYFTALALLLIPSVLRRVPERDTVDSDSDLNSGQMTERRAIFGEAGE